MGLPPKIIQIIDHFGVETHGFEATHGETSIMSHGFLSLFPTIFPEVGTKDCFQQGVRRRPWCCSGRVCHQRGIWIRQNPHFFLDVNKIKRHLSPHFNTASGLNIFETH